MAALLYLSVSLFCVGGGGEVRGGGGEREVVLDVDLIVSETEFS